jgi:hypothetical protein
MCNEKNALLPGECPRETLALPSKEEVMNC